MILCLDSGNSRLKWGVHDGSAWLARGALAQSDIDALPPIADAHRPARIVAANVAGGAVRQRIGELLNAHGPVHWIASGPRAGGVTSHYRNPAQLGVDRWCALIGARQRSAGACMVVMAGTATTIDSLDADGHFLGGLILPGLALMHRALARDTADLPLADGEYSRFPDCTADAISSGCLEAQAGAIERAYHRLPGARLCLLSGGNAARLAPHLALPVLTVDNLVLDGLAHLAGASNS